MWCSTLHNDYVTQQARHFRARKRVADEHPPGAVPKPLERLFLQLLYTHWRKVTEFENVSSSQKSGRSIVIDF